MAAKAVALDGAAQALADGGAMLLSQMLPGPENEPLRQQAIRVGTVPSATPGRDIQIKVRAIPGSTDHEVMAVAAVVGSDPGLTKGLVQAIDDYTPFQTPLPKQIEIPALWNMYQNEGVVNNAVNKISAVLSAGGAFKVKGAKLGKKQNAQQQLQAMLDEFNTNVNNAPLDGVVTGSRGLKAVIQQGVRTALVEGDWFCRTVWTNHQVPQFAVASLPMTMQTMSTSQIVPATEISGYGIEAYYWQPSQTLLQQVTKPSNKDTAKIIKKFVPTDILAQLKKNGKVFLDPALQIHIKHRGCDFQPFGESFIKSAQFAMAYKKALDNLDLVSIQSLINRFLLIQVGASENPNSRYNDPAFAVGRQQLMAGYFANPGPNMAVIWQGDDVKVTDVGAHDKLADTKERHAMAMSRIKIALGVPDALLSGTTEQDGKAAGWAATIASSGQLEELRNAIENAMTSIGERIAVENSFEQFDVAYQFDNSLMSDKSEEYNQARLDYQQGTMSIQKYADIRGIDAEVEFQQRCFEQGLDPDSALWKDVFVPLAGLPGQGLEPLDGDGSGGGAKATPPGTGPGKAPGQGRPAGNPGGNTKQPPKESKTPNENK